MKIFFSDYFNVTKETLDQFGALDVSMVGDLPLFIDPFLLYASKKPEYNVQHQLIVRYLEFLFDYCRRHPHANMMASRSYFEFPEVKNLSLGFCHRGNQGRGLGKDFANALIGNIGSLMVPDAHERISESSHLEKLCIVARRVGCDSISDFTANIIKDFLLCFTERFARGHLRPEQCHEFSVGRAVFDFEKQCWTSKKYYLPNHNGEYVILTPLDILTCEDTWISKDGLLHDFRHLPESVGNKELQEKLVSLLADIYDRKRPLGNAERHSRALAFCAAHPELIDIYIRKQEGRKDEAIVNARNRTHAVEEFNIIGIKRIADELGSRAFYSEEGSSLEAARRRALIFKDYLENNDGRQMFFSSHESRISEKQIQSAFGLLWLNSDKSADREPNNGRGPVDFKISQGAHDACLVEFKLASNPQLEHNLKNQMKVYKAANRTANSLTMIFLTDEKDRVRMDGILCKLGLGNDPDYIVVDITPKLSASKVK